MTEEGDARRRAGVQQLRGAAADEVARIRVGASRREPLRVLACLGAPLEVGARDVIRLILIHECRSPRSWLRAGHSISVVAPGWRTDGSAGRVEDRARSLPARSRR